MHVRHFTHLFSVFSSPSVFLPGTPAAAPPLLSDPELSSSLREPRTERGKREREREREASLKMKRW